MVLDEADRMISAGNFPELKSILSLLPKWTHSSDKLHFPKPKPQIPDQNCDDGGNDDDDGDDQNGDDDEIEIDNNCDVDDNGGNDDGEEDGDNGDNGSNDNFEVENDDDNNSGDEDDNGNDEGEGGNEEEDEEDEIDIEEKIKNWEEKEEKKVVLTAKRQTFICSATLGTSGFIKSEEEEEENKDKKKKKKESFGDLLNLIDFHRNKRTIDLSNIQLTAKGLYEAKIHCLDDEKDYYLYYIISKYVGRTLIFVNSISCLRRLIGIFSLLRLPLFSLHAQMQQKQRLKNLERFKANPQSILIASDVAARGLDIPLVDHVIHYQLPRTSELYVHRSGRTARYFPPFFIPHSHPLYIYNHIIFCILCILLLYIF